MNQHEPCPTCGQFPPEHYTEAEAKWLRAARRELAELIRETEGDGTAPAQSRDAGLRAIDSLAPDLSPEAGDRLTDLVERDRSGLDSRYLTAASKTAYISAFGKRLADPTFVTGTGTDEPEGILVGGTSIVTAGTATFAVGDVCALQEDEPASVRF